MLKRRSLIAMAVGAAGYLAWSRLSFGATVPVEGAFAVTHPDDEWKRLLSAEQYHVLRRSGTERPFTSPLNKEERTGTFACAGCDLPLFSSDTKFDSRTGWPSFYAAIPTAVGDTRDVGLLGVRTANHCNRCGSHLGHVFSDGPRPTGLRYCMNGVAMTFTPKFA